MASLPTSSHLKASAETHLVSASKAPAYSSKSSTTPSPASPQPSKDAPRATKTVSIMSVRPQLAIKPVASASGPGVQPLQQKAAAAGSPAINVMSMNSVVSPMPQSPAAQSPTSSTGMPLMSITSKEWVIPPRPKPGRKPATDTPPTKRKAQNRAAQRAFRERRAARVGELEDQLDEQKSEFERIQQESQDKILSLEAEVQALQSRCQMLESLLEKEKAAHAWTSVLAADNDARSSSSGTLPNPALQPHHRGHILSPIPHKPLNSQLRGSASSSFSSSSGRRTSAQPFSISQIISPPDEGEDLTCGSCNTNSGSCACAEEVMAATSSLDCGKCSLGTKCVCLEDSLKAFSSEGGSMDGDLKRPHPPASPSLAAPDEKKARHTNQSMSRTSTETDFTHIFSRPKQTSVRTPLPSMPGQQLRPQLFQQQTARMEIPLKDKCGFCSDGTYCVCADTMPGVTMTGSLALTSGTMIAQQKTPPPSENDCVPVPLEVTATGAIKLSSMSSLRRQAKLAAPPTQSGPLPPPSSSCGPGGPGTCSQCLADPISGLFCRSLAASFERRGSGKDGERSGGCCGGGGAGGCCKNKDKAAGGYEEASSRQVKEERKTTGSSLSLSCAEAYKTLSSHRHFDEATDEIGTWLPMLKAVPRHESTANPTERHPMEVEAASIMSVLKGFDVRFGK